MDPITIPAANEGAEVDLWGTTYRMVPATRSLSKKLQPLWEKYQQAVTDDENVETLADVISARLANSNGSRKTAAALIKEKWRADELSLQQLLAFHQRLAEADIPN